LTQPKKGVEISLDQVALVGGASDGIVYIAVKPETIPFRLRIIAEDIDAFHQGANAEENYFGQQMIEDFYSPVEGLIQM